MDKLGRTIYSYRRINGVSQEELAKIAGVSSGAVSKWERDISIPDLDVLCKLADYFQISLDELVGRKQDRLMDIHFDNQWEANRYFVALELLEYCSIGRNQGLLAIEEAAKKKNQSAYSFLKFAVEFIMNGFQKQMPLEDCKRYLERYGEREKDIWTAKMICSAIILIFSGENESIVREDIQSFLGRKYSAYLSQNHQMNRHEVMEGVINIQTDFSDTGILDSLLDVEDYEIQLMLRQLNNEEFVQALLGTSKEIRIKLLQNLSERMLFLICEDLKNCVGDTAAIENAQKKMIHIVKEN